MLLFISVYFILIWGGLPVVSEWIWTDLAVNDPYLTDGSSQVKVQQY